MSKRRLKGKPRHTSPSHVHSTHTHNFFKNKAKEKKGTVLIMVTNARFLIPKNKDKEANN
jgi:hypothetical protein